MPPLLRRAARPGREATRGTTRRDPTRARSSLPPANWWLLEGVLCGIHTALEAVNVPNADYMPGLRGPSSRSARADASGLHPAAIAPLPEGILGLLSTQTSINRLLVDGFASGSRRTLLQTLLLDPTTHSYRAAVHTIDEMFRLQHDVLPAWSGSRAVLALSPSGRTDPGIAPARPARPDRQRRKRPKLREGPTRPAVHRATRPTPEPRRPPRFGLH